MATRKRGSGGKAKPRPVKPAEGTHAPAAVAPSFMAMLPKATMGGGAQDVPETASTSQVCGLHLHCIMNV